MAFITATGAQRGAKNSRIQVNGANLKFKKFDVDFQVNDIGTVNFESAGSIGTLVSGMDEGLAGVVKAPISFGGDWDAATNPVDPGAIPGIYPRDDLKNVFCIINVVDATQWAFPYMRVRSAKNGAAVDGAVSFEASGFNQGVFSPPSGSFNTPST